MTKTAISLGDVWAIEYRLLDGDPMNPDSCDILVAQGRLQVGRRLPHGWRVLTGNESSSSVAAIGYRYEFEHMLEAAQIVAELERSRA